MALFGLLGGGGDGAKKREAERAAEEEARRAAEEAEERRQAEQEAAEERARAAEEAAAEQRERAAEAFERREVREDERGAPVLNRLERDPERDALGALAMGDEPKGDVPAYTMTIPEDEIRTSVTIPEDEIRTSVTIPEDEIRFTPGGGDEPDIYQRVLDASARYQSAPALGGRDVNFSALDAQADAADVASRQQAEANLASPPTNVPAVAPQQAATPAAAPGATTGPAPSSPLAPPVQPPAPQSLPEQQAAATAEQQATQPAGSRIPQDVRTAAMPAPDGPEPRLATPAGPAVVEPQAAQPGGASLEDEARRALRQERIMKALGYITQLGAGIGGVALAARGGSPTAARLLGAAGGAIGGALTGASPTQQQARIAQARQADLAQARQGEEIDLRAAAQRAQERRQAMLDAQGAQRLDLDARRVAAMEEGLGLRARQTEAQAAAAEALAAERASRGQRQTEEAAIEAARRDPASELSRQAQRELRVTMQAVPEGERVPDAEIDTLSAETAEMLNTQFARRFGLRTRAAQRTGGGGGLGGAPMSATEARAALVERGLDPALADSLPPRELARLLRNEATRSLREGITSEGREILPGVFTRLEMTSGEVARLRDGFDSMRSGMLSLGRVGEVAERFGGPAARISPQARAAIVPELTLLRSMVAQMGNTGVIQPSEVPTINAALPNPGDLEQMTFGSFDARLSQWQRIVSDRARSALETRGVSGPQVERALRALRVGFAAADRGEGGERRQRQGTIRITRPDGRSITRPDTPEERERAEAAGFDVEEL